MRSALSPSGSKPVALRMGNSEDAAVTCAAVAGPGRGDRGRRGRDRDRAAATAGRRARGRCWPRSCEAPQNPTMVATTRNAAMIASTILDWSRLGADPGLARQHGQRRVERHLVVDEGLVEADPALLGPLGGRLPLRPAGGGLVGGGAGEGAHRGRRRHPPPGRRPDRRCRGPCPPRRPPRRRCSGRALAVDRRRPRVSGSARRSAVVAGRVAPPAAAAAAAPVRADRGASRAGPGPCRRTGRRVRQLVRGVVVAGVRQLEGRVVGREVGQLGVVVVVGRREALRRPGRPRRAAGLRQRRRRAGRWCGSGRGRPAGARATRARRPGRWPTARSGWRSRRG